MNFLGLALLISQSAGLGCFLPFSIDREALHPIFSISLSPNPYPQTLPKSISTEADALPSPNHTRQRRRPTVHRHPLRRTRREEPPSPPSSPFEEKLSPSEKLNRRSGKVADVVCDAFQVWACSVTSVVGAEEETKQAVSKELNSTCSSPYEWFICDEDQTGTRYFVIQGLESFASWQANLLFEPIQFEGLDVLVHRGIYEAAKGIYDQMLPEVHGHLKSRGPSATFRFTGHSLGGSLSLLVSLMLLIHGEVPLSALLPVITFGAPSVMCGGDQLLHRLGLPRSHVQAITMHRDIVPQAFSCNYPGHVAELLKAVSGKFRNHPCLKNQCSLCPHGRDSNPTTTGESLSTT